MSKAMRQMPQRCGRAGVARGEAARDPVSDEASGPPREHPLRVNVRRLPFSRDSTPLRRWDPNFGFDRSNQG